MPTEAVEKPIQDTKKEEVDDDDDADSDTKSEDSVPELQDAPGPSQQSQVRCNWHLSIFSLFHS